MESEYIFCKNCRADKELLYKDDIVVAEKCNCKNTKRINGLKPLDYFFKTYGDTNANTKSLSKNQRNLQKSKVSK
jgi:hypothetical protein